MKPPAFDYYAPATVEEVLELLREHGEDAKILAGGQSLVPLMKLGFAQPACLVDINHVKGLAGLVEGEVGIEIGALTRHREIAASPLLHKACPLLPYAASQIGNPQVRNRGTIGGSLCHADAAAELPTAIKTLRAEIEVVGRNGARRIAADDFFADFMATSLEQGELLVRVHVPPWQARTGWAFEELRRRQVDHAIVAVGALLTLDQDGVCRHASLVSAGTALTPQRASSTESWLLGKTLSHDVVSQAAAAIEAGATPGTDAHATAEYRRKMAGVLARRALEEAARRAARTA